MTKRYCWFAHLVIQCDTQQCRIGRSIRNIGLSLRRFPLRNVLVLALLLASAPVSAVLGQASRSTAPETVVVPSGKLRLRGYLWKPAGSAPSPAVLFAHGSGGTDSAHTSGLLMTEAAEKLASVFLKHGYGFLYLFRRGQGLSAGQGTFMQDLLRGEKTEESRKHLQVVLLTTDHLDDTMAGL